MCDFVRFSEALAPAGYEIFSFDTGTSSNYWPWVKLLISKTKDDASSSLEVAKVFADIGYLVIAFSCCQNGQLEFSITPARQ